MRAAKSAQIAYSKNLNGPGVRGDSQVAKATDCKSVTRGFDSHSPLSIKPGCAILAIRVFSFAGLTSRVFFVNQRRLARA